MPGKEFFHHDVKDGFNYLGKHPFKVAVYHLTVSLKKMLSHICKVAGEASCEAEVCDLHSCMTCTDIPL